MIDEDVDLAVSVAIRAEGHDVWTLAQAGRVGGNDGDQLVYAERKDAVFVTHDHELVNSRRAMPMHRIIHLDCPKPIADELVVEVLPMVESMLERTPYVIVNASRRSNGNPNVSADFRSEGRSQITEPVDT